MVDKKKLMQILSKVYINKKEFSELMNSDYVISAKSVGTLDSIEGQQFSKYIVVTADEENLTLMIEADNS